MGRCPRRQRTCPVGCAWLWGLRSSAERAPSGNLHGPISSPALVSPNTGPMYPGSAHGLPFPTQAPEVKEGAVRALLGWRGERGPREEQAAPPRFPTEPPDKRRKRGGFRVSLRLAHMVYVGRHLRALGLTRHRCPKWPTGVLSPCGEIRHCSTHGSPAS